MFPKSMNGTIGRGDGSQVIIPMSNEAAMQKGVGVWSPTRASGVWVNDFEGIPRYIESGVMAFEGLRVVKNLLTYSEDFSNAAWTKGASTAVLVANSHPSNRVVYSLKETATTAWHDLGAVNLTTMLQGRTYRYSIDVKADGRSAVCLFQITVGSSAKSAVFDLSNGSINGYYTSSGGTLASACCQSLGDGWYRISIKFTLGTIGIAGYNRTRLIIRDSVGNFTAAHAGDITKGVLCTAAQLEDVTNQANQNPSEYIKTTTAPASQFYPYLNPYTVDGNGVVTDSGVRTPLFPTDDISQYALRTPSTAYTEGQKVWALDAQGKAHWWKCKTGGTSGLNSAGKEVNFAVNGGFDADTNWVKGAGVTISGGTANFANAGAASALYAGWAMVQNKKYTITFTVLNYVSGVVYPNAAGTAQRTASGTYTETYTHTNASANFAMGCSAFTGSLDNISITEYNPMLTTGDSTDGSVIWEYGGLWRGAGGQLNEPASTNKCTCWGVPPTGVYDAIQTGT